MNADKPLNSRHHWKTVFIRYAKVKAYRCIVVTKENIRFEVSFAAVLLLLFFFKLKFDLLIQYFSLIFLKFPYIILFFNSKYSKVF